MTASTPHSFFPYFIICNGLTAEIAAVFNCSKKYIQLISKSLRDFCNFLLSFKDITIDEYRLILV
jgi:hypothetical protein